MLGNMHFRTEL